MKIYTFLIYLLVPGFILLTFCQRGDTEKHHPPNIILVLVDDLGYGDLSCYNPDSRIHTPNMDELARQGMMFTDAHSSAAQCSPTRYGLLTGRYSWRTELRTGVLPHFARPLIEDGRMTIASLLQQKGYATACIGKWHLGMGWEPQEGASVDYRSWDASQNRLIDYGKPLTLSPNNYGFDYYFGINASNNMLPYCLIENDRVVNIPEQLKYPVFDSEYEQGLVSPDYDSEQLEQILFSKAMDWLNHHLDSDPDQPFFLYYPMSAIHRPCLPLSRFRNSAKAGLRGDKVVEVDQIIGELMEWLKRNRLEKNTIFILTSDNGPRPGDPMQALTHLASNQYGQKYRAQDLIRQDSLLSMNGPYNKPKGAEMYHIYHHFASGPFRGYKFDIYEGGHRVPFIVRWPGVVKADIEEDAVISTIDFMATFADLLEIQLPDNAGEDSYSFLPLLNGRHNHYPGRPNLVHKACKQDALAIRKGDWKLIPFRNGGGLYRFPDVPEEGQLYNLRDDPGEQQNLYIQHPEKVKELKEELNRVVAEE
ncbi:MAG: arylsulfatase [Bacteroidales bacterium]|nr:arylsulfatase [Bacteroidales bacterium]